MLSSQELQEELALWSNAQFQLEPVADEHTAKGVESTYKHHSAPEHNSQQQPQHQNAWGFLDLAPQKQGGHTQYSTAQPSSANGAQINPLSFMMDAASTSDLINAITSSGNSAHSQWAQLAQQQQQQLKAASFGGVSMMPLVPLSQQSTAQPPVSPAVASSKMMAIAPSSTTKQLHHTPIVPKSAAPSDVFNTNTNTNSGTASAQLAALRKAAANKRSPAMSATAAATQKPEGGAENKDQSEDENEDDTQRKTAAEEDKRRRNTAASARFRIKKKLKEQALERTAREMSEKAEALEKRVQELEVETRWLKSLITERDPDALNNVSCPCHHPNGLEGGEGDATSKPLASTSAAPRRTVSIAPNPASGAEPPFKKAKI
ncbi:hypothetical protein H4R20_006263 [Coemansia guatemalensis]|uniref:BZIP domain-containing protein n=1 Tax=Coemansia guatemalensis TaxID=2761395 RepID=A0A9W8HN96_9FUNG|nr:hypothetical protein H4R20_006263 [Coemansia guatemalensis]